MYVVKFLWLFWICIFFLSFPLLNYFAGWYMLRGITNIPEFEIRNEIERSISPEKIENETIGKYWPFDHSTRFWNKRQKEEYPRLNVILNSFRLTMHIFLTEIVFSLYALWRGLNHNCFHSQIIFKLVTFSRFSIQLLEWT